MSQYDYRDIHTMSGKVYLNFRHWDGIDKPDIFSTAGLTPSQAKSMVIDLEVAINAALKEELEILQDKLDNRRDEYKTAQVRIGNLELEIENLQKAIASGQQVSL